MNTEQNLTDLLFQLDEQGTLAAVRARLEAGEGVRTLLDELSKGMDLVGRAYSDKEYYLADLIMAAEIFKQAMELLQPAMAAEGAGAREPIGRIVVGTVEGDLHDIGKNIFVALARNAGFAVNDLGIDVPPATFVEHVQRDEAHILGLSGILTMSLEPMARTVKHLEEAGLRDKVKVIIGGLPVDERWAKFTGADAFTDDAYEGLRIVRGFMGVE